jgi:hypothetical protein
MNRVNDEKIWVIQRCIDAWTNHYEDWLGYSETPMTRSEMLVALEKCNNEWPDYEFRGHNIQSLVERHAFGEYPKFPKLG